MKITSLRKRMYKYIWEYRIHPDHSAEFESSYGEKGEWVGLFQRHPGYIGTELLKDQNEPLRFLTIDTWISRAQYLSFREEFRKEFDAIDTKCEAYTIKEQFLGDFDSQE